MHNTKHEAPIPMSRFLPPQMASGVPILPSCTANIESTRQQHHKAQHAVCW